MISSTICLECPGQTLRAGLAVLLVLVFLPQSVPAQEQPIDARLIEIDGLFAEWNNAASPGAAVAIVEKGEVVYKRHFGLASLEQNVPISSRTRFDLGSVSKQFTAMAILMLEREGKLGLDDTIQTYLPELPRYDHPITLSHLLHHTSGLWDYWQVLPYTGYRKQDYIAFEDVSRLLQGQKKLTFEPGSKWSYCNTNYVFLAEIVARVTGETFADWVKQHIFVPLKMWDSFCQSDCFALIPGRAEAYRTVGEDVIRDHQMNVDFAGQSHIFSTIQDMVRWTDNFRSRSLGGKMLMTRMTRKGELNDGREIFYAAGLGVVKYRGATTVGHSGATGGFSSVMLYLPEFQTGIIILSNVRSLDPEGMAHRMIDIYFRGSLEPLPMKPVLQPEPFIELDSAITSRYVGGYLMEGGESRLGLFQAGDRLMGAITGLGMDSFYPLSETEFAIRSRKVRLTIRTDERGWGSSVEIDLKGKHMRATRIQTDTTLTISSECAGAYYSDALGVRYDLTPVGEGLLLSHPRMGERMLQYVDKDLFVGRLGFLKFSRDIEGRVRGFFLEDEVFGEGDVCFAKWMR